MRSCFIHVSRRVDLNGARRSKQGLRMENGVVTCACRCAHRTTSIGSRSESSLREQSYRNTLLLTGLIAQVERKCLYAVAKISVVLTVWMVQMLRSLISWCMGLWATGFCVWGYRRADLDVRVVACWKENSTYPEVLIYRYNEMQWKIGKMSNWFS